jgi:hypothetical protein
MSVLLLVLLLLLPDELLIWVRGVVLEGLFGLFAGVSGPDYWFGETCLDDRGGRRDTRCQCCGSRGGRLLLVVVTTRHKGKQSYSIKLGESGNNKSKRYVLQVFEKLIIIVIVCHTRKEIRSVCLSQSTVEECRHYFCSRQL